MCSTRYAPGHFPLLFVTSSRNISISLFQTINIDDLSKEVNSIDNDIDRSLFYQEFLKFPADIQAEKKLNMYFIIIPHISLTSKIEYIASFIIDVIFKLYHIIYNLKLMGNYVNRSCNFPKLRLNVLLYNMIS